MEDVSTTTAILVNLIENWNIAWDTKSFRGLVITVQRSRYSFLPVGCSVMLQSLSNHLFVSLWLLWLPTGFLLLWIPHRCLLMVSHAAMLLYGLCSCSKLLTHFPSLPHIYPLPDKGIVSTGLVTLWPLKTALFLNRLKHAALATHPPLTLLALVRAVGSPQKDMLIGASIQRGIVICLHSQLPVIRFGGGRREASVRSAVPFLSSRTRPSFRS